MKLFLFFLTTLAYMNPTAVDAQASAYNCYDEPCVESFEESCDQLLYNYNWEGSCCSLADNEAEGCTLTVANGDCTSVGRTYIYFMESADDPFLISGLGNSLEMRDSIVVDATDMMECPVSEYDAFARPKSDDDMKAGLSITLSGMSSPLTFDQTEEWRQVTEAYIVETFDEQYNLIVQFSMPPEDSFPMELNGNGELEMVFLAQVSWRNYLNETDIDIMTFLEGALNQSDAYLAALQATETFGVVTAASPLIVLPVPSDEQAAGTSSGGDSVERGGHLRRR